MFFNFEDRLIKGKEIIGIFDMDNTTVSGITRQFLNLSEKKKQVITLSYDLPKSFIICERNGKITNYISEYSTATIIKRAGFLKELTLL